MEKGNMHAGHRQRLKQTLIESDFAGVADINFLETLLFYAVPRGDTNETAHRLLEAFGSLEAVFEADYHSLLQVKGVGENSAFLIKLVNKGARRLCAVNTGKAVYIKSNKMAADVLEPYFIGEKDEKMLAMFLDNGGKLISVTVLGKGVVNTVGFHNRTLIEGAIRTNCASVILAHNHPHGIANPSREDLRMTAGAREALHTINVSLLDHMIYAEGEWQCLSERRDAAQYLTRTK